MGHEYEARGQYHATELWLILLDDQTAVFQFSKQAAMAHEEWKGKRVIGVACLGVQSIQVIP